MSKMIKLFYRVLLIALFCTAWDCAAETDYVCFKACIGNNETYTKCMPKCSYDAAQKESNDEHADLNIPCFKTCVEGGGVSAACLPQCTAVSTQSTRLVASAEASHAKAPAYNAFKPLMPGDDVVLSSPAHAVPQEQNEDYACLKLCVQGGMRYGLCNQRCTR